MKILGLDHIAIAVRALKDALPLYQEIMGFQLKGVEEVPTEGMRAAMMKKDGLTVELMESTDPKGAVGRFVEKWGGGLHHVTFQVEDIEAAVQECRDRGLELIEPAPRPGVHGKRIAFLHPRSTGGVLIELSQRPREP